MHNKNGSGLKIGIEVVPLTGRTLSYQLKKGKRKSVNVSLDVL